MTNADLENDMDYKFDASLSANVSSIAQMSEAAILAAIANLGIQLNKRIDNLEIQLHNMIDNLEIITRNSSAHAEDDNICTPHGHGNPPAYFPTTVS